MSVEDKTEDYQNYSSLYCALPFDWSDGVSASCTMGLIVH